MAVSVLTWVWVGCTALAFVALWVVLQLMGLRGCGYWIAFIFWGGLSAWALLMFVSGKVHL